MSLSHAIDENSSMLSMSDLWKRICLFRFFMDYSYLVKVVRFDLEKRRIIIEKYGKMLQFHRLARNEENQ